MISTVTTSTITTVTAMIGFGAAAGVMAAIALITFLCARELSTASKDSKYRLLARSLDVSIFPLLIAFAVLTVMTILKISA